MTALRFQTGKEHQTSQTSLKNTGHSETLIVIRLFFHTGKHISCKHTGLPTDNHEYIHRK